MHLGSCGPSVVMAVLSRRCRLLAPGGKNLKDRCTEISGG